MSRKRTPMRNIRQILTHRLTHKLSLEQTASAVRKSKGCVHNICQRFVQSALSWPLADTMTDEQLEHALFPPSTTPSSSAQTAGPLPDIAYIEQELAKKHVTIALLYHEYRQQHPQGMSQASFYRYVRSQKKPTLSMHQHYKGGDILYCDYSGEGLEYIDPHTGDIHTVELFVATLAASSLTYAEAGPSQQAHDFTMAHVRAFEFFGGVSGCIVPDNLKSAVTKANRYDPTINHLFAAFAQHYGTVILPTRVAAPRDKGSVESAVLVAQRWIVAALRQQTFFSRKEVNDAISEQLAFINVRPMKDHGGQSRTQRFEHLDKPYLRPLPPQRFAISVIKHGVYVGLNYHVQFQKHFYSVPFQLVKQRVDIHLCGTTVEIYHNNEHCCRHLLSTRSYGYTTKDEHMPPNHVFVRGLRPELLIKRAEAIGPQCALMAAALMKRGSHPQQGFRAVQGLLALQKAYGAQRLENACTKALQFKATRLGDVKSILQNGLDEQQILPFAVPVSPRHENIRGPQYYQQ